MPTDAEWRAMIADGKTRAPVPIDAQSFLKKEESDSKPVKLTCSDKHDYYVKGLQLATDPARKRVLINDQIVARLGLDMGAPVGVPALVQVPQELIKAQSDMSHLQEGVAHGCRMILNVTNRSDLEYVLLPENRFRFALIAVLYGWMNVSDRQVIYDEKAPHLVYSVDHGHFIGGPNWDVALFASPSPAIMVQDICNQCNFTDAEKRAALSTLAYVSDQRIADALAIPPDTWMFPEDERITLAKHLAARRDALLTTMPQ